MYKKSKNRFLDIVSNHEEIESFIGFIPDNCPRIDVKPKKAEIVKEQRPLKLNNDQQNK